MEFIKNLLKNIFELVYDKIKDSTLYNTLLEKYDHLDLHVQKGIKYSASAIGILLIVSLPLSILKHSLDMAHEFKAKKQLIFDLIKNEASQFAVQGMNSQEFNRKISQTIDGLDLSADQKVQISSYYFSKKLLPKNLRALNYSGKQIKIIGINIEEVMDIGKRLSQINLSVKLVHLKVIELKDRKNYFSAVYSVLHFHEPHKETPITPDKNPV